MKNQIIKKKVKNSTFSGVFLILLQIANFSSSVLSSALFFHPIFLLCFSLSIFYSSLKLALIHFLSICLPHFLMMLAAVAIAVLSSETYFFGSDFISLQRRSDAAALIQIQEAIRKDVGNKFRSLFNLINKSSSQFSLIICVIISPASLNVSREGGKKTCMRNVNERK